MKIAAQLAVEPTDVLKRVEARRERDVDDARKHAERELQTAKEAHAREIKALLDEYVIGQETAKKKLAVAVYNHYRRIEFSEKASRSG